LQNCSDTHLVVAWLTVNILQLIIFPYEQVVTRISSCHNTSCYATFSFSTFGMLLQWTCWNMIQNFICHVLCWTKGQTNITYTKKCMNRWLFVSCNLLGCDTMWSCRWLQTFQRNIGKHLQDHMVSQSRRPQSTSSRLWEPQISDKWFCGDHFTWVSKILCIWFL
jgi:hypothetical protein